MRSLAADLEELGAIGGGADGGVTRLAWSPALAAANAWFVARLEEEGLAAAVDAAGNVIGRWAAGSGPAVLVASHLDTVPSGGRYDGALGVLAGLEAVRILRRAGVEPRRPLWLASFNDEEGAGFGTGFLGSRSFVGDLDLEFWRRRGVADAMAAAGFAFEGLPGARAVEGVGAYLELHIEQGPVLEAAGADVGLVTGVVGLLGYRIRLAGVANHAGTTPMHLRRDALAGAARVVLALRDEALATDGLVATVGRIHAEPGGLNVVPGAVELTVDARAPTAEGLAAADRLVRETVAAAAAAEELDATIEPLHRVEPTPLDPGLRAALARAAETEGARAVELPSGAGHDAMILARHVPAAMLFVPSRGGVSHSPDEHTDAAACELGTRVLARALVGLVT